MKTLKRLSKKATKFCSLSGYDTDKIRELMKYESFSILKIETKKEIDDEGVDYNYPYKIFNPFNFDLK